MTRSTPTSCRLLLSVLLLAGALLACTLSWGQDEGGTPEPPGGIGPGADSGTAPTVRILEPASGARVPRNQRVDVTVETGSTATSFLLSIGGRVAGTKALPPGQSGPTKAILSWLPDRDGTYSLEVIAFNGSAASAPAAMILEVSGTASAASPSGVAGCVGRVLVSQLNYRSAPSMDQTRLGQFDVGETVTVVGRSGDTGWYRVQRINAEQVWVINNAQWMQIEGQCETLPVAG